jgi:4-hydroxy-3-polyprenylbenzoate decarboxylase
MLYNDLREYVKEAEKLGELKVIEGADWDLEVGTITELMAKANTPLLLFDKIKGYPPGYRIVTNLAASKKRVSMFLGLPEKEKPIDYVKAWRERGKGGFKPIPPVQVKTGPVMENVHTGNEIDLFEFPTPRWHEDDGGRYIGTGDVVVTKDPDEGWVNVGTYRIQIHDKNTATIWTDEGHHGDVIKKKYWARGKPCPVVVGLGQDPILQLVAIQRVPWAISEYDYAGWIRQRPIEVIQGPVTGLPIPASAEIVLEGEIVPPEMETRIEGPFGEFTGYYGRPAGPVAAFRVKAVYHRNNPILQGNPPYRWEPLYWSGRDILKASMIWDEVSRRVPGIKGVWIVEEGLLWILVVSVEQQYVGHAKEAAIAARSAHFLFKFVIVVDDDIDPSNMAEVLWAMATRCDPEVDIDIVRGLHGILLDPIISPEKRNRSEIDVSAAIINACRPFCWKKDFPKTVGSSPELIARVKNKFGI